MSTPFINPALPLESVFDSRNLIPRYVEQLVPILNPQYARPALSKLIDVLPNALQTKADNRKFRINRMPNDYPNMTITVRNTSGSNLIVTVDNNNDNLDALPVGHAVVSTNTDCWAEIVAKDNDNGTATLRFVAKADGSTAFVSADFAVGDVASDRGYLGDINDRAVGQTVFTLPTEYSNVIGQLDAYANISHEDVNNKTYIDNQFGNPYYALMKESQALQRLMQQYYARCYSDNPAVLEGSKPLGAGLINQIKTMGGISTGIVGTLSLAAFKSAVRAYVANGGFTGDEIVVLAGSQYLGDVQDFLEPYILTAGTNNTVGGAEVKGLNITKYAFEGLNFNFIKDPFLDNQLMWGSAGGFSKRSGSAIWMNTDACKTEQGMPVSFVADYYFSKTQDVQRWEVPGSMDSKGNPVNVGSNGKKGCEINFTLDKQTQLMNPAGCMYHGN